MPGVECYHARRDADLQGNGDGRSADLVRVAKATDDGALRFSEAFGHGEERRTARARKRRDPTHGRIPDRPGANESGCAPGAERAGGENWYVAGGRGARVDGIGTAKKGITVLNGQAFARESLLG